VDGLWFMKVEEELGFDKALEIDNEVWKVIPKIQARMLKSLMKMEYGLDALFQCFTTKLTIDGFKYKSEKRGSCFTVIIEKCPWNDLMVKSGRENLSGKVGTRICKTEYAVWATEFNENINFEMQDQICNGSVSCILKFQSV
jgi:hypothetical protein